MSFKAVVLFINLLAAVTTSSTASPLEDSLHSETTEPDAYWALSNWVIKRDEASVAQSESDASAEPDAYWALSNWVIKREEDPDATVEPDAYWALSNWVIKREPYAEEQ